MPVPEKIFDVLHTTIRRQVAEEHPIVTAWHVDKTLILKQNYTKYKQKHTTGQTSTYRYLVRKGPNSTGSVNFG
jgi:hypothetical protein